MAKKISITEILTPDGETELTLATKSVKEAVSKFLKENFDDETCKAILATVCIRLIYEWSKDSKPGFITESVRFIAVLNRLVDHVIKKECL